MDRVGPLELLTKAILEAANKAKKKGYLRIDPAREFAAPFLVYDRIENNEK
ncbi:MAG: hypothetical protein AAAB35_08845 [Phyllobacterium sp.]|uniref:hypothetical protein n=1 Tax=Phyllobacterium sp. TaxID=1871046 RepID=UPI0030F0B481